MTVHEASHDMQMVTANRWETFLDEVDQQHKGKLVSLEINQDVLVDGRPAAQVVLQGVEYHKHKGVTVTTGSGTETETHTVKSPDIIWAAHDDHGGLLGVELVGRDGQTLVLRLEP